jgi:hypothetical protein
LTPLRRLSEQAFLLLAILGIVTGTIVVVVAAAVVTPTVLVEPTPTPTPTPVPPTATQLPHTLTITSGPVGKPNPVASGGTASLSVSAADSLNHLLGYNWTASCPGLGANGSFNNAALQSPTWTAPANTTGGQQDCTLQVTVSDDAGLTQSGSYSQGVQSLSHTLTITSGPVGKPNPVASGGTASLSVSAADSLNHLLGYNWTASCPGLGANGSFNNAALQSPTWTAPANTTGDQQSCTLQATVSDGANLTQSGSYSQGVQSLPHTLTITSGPVGKPNPVASGGTASLRVSAADSLNHLLGYNWTASCPGLESNGSFNNAALQSPTWSAPANTTGDQQNCTLQVTVSDGAGLTQSRSYSQGVQSLTHTLTINETQVAAKQTLVRVTGGTVAVDPAPGSEGRYASGTPVTLTAAPAIGWDFLGWSGAGCSGTGRCVVRMDSDKSVKASFSGRILRSGGLETVHRP